VSITAGNEVFLNKFVITADGALHQSPRSSRAINNFISQGFFGVGIMADLVFNANEGKLLQSEDNQLQHSIKGMPTGHQTAYGLIIMKKHTSNVKSMSLYRTWKLSLMGRNLRKSMRSLFMACLR
jgi:hypothetical protein